MQCNSHNQATEPNGIKFQTSGIRKNKTSCQIWYVRFLMVNRNQALTFFFAPITLILVENGIGSTYSLPLIRSKEISD